MRSFRIFFYAVMITLLAGSSVLAAEKMQQPKVEYSADTYFETEQASFNGRVYHALGGKDRQEMKMEGTSQIIITRMDKEVAWILMPDQKMYMESDLKSSKKDHREITDCDVDMKSTGSDTVNGIKATKNSVSMSCPDGARYTGDIWTTKDGIMVRAVVTGKTKGSKNVRIKTELKNLKIGKQNPSLFEVPEGYAKMSMGNMMKDLVPPGTKKQTGEGAAKTKTGRDYTSQQRTGRDYTAQQRTGRDYTAQQRETQTDKVDNTFKKVRGLFGF